MGVVAEEEKEKEAKVVEGGGGKGAITTLATRWPLWKLLMEYLPFRYKKPRDPLPPLLPFHRRHRLRLRIYSAPKP
uniref:Uncharacterized protein n=1 Tax=Oryza meridionalis TaxID=40149 RepID=A0A0E0C3J5_9ORYZ